MKSWLFQSRITILFGYFLRITTIPILLVLFVLHLRRVSLLVEIPAFFLLMLRGAKKCVVIISLLAIFATVTNPFIVPTIPTHYFYFRPSEFKYIFTVWNASWTIVDPLSSLRQRNWSTILPPRIKRMKVSS